jgi:hypothetical protein
MPAEVESMNENYNNKNLQIILLFLFWQPSKIYTKIRILTFHYNRPEFIEIQHKTFQKFLKEKDDYELIVFNDAKDENKQKEIRSMCSLYNIKCIDFPQELHKNNLVLKNLLSFIEENNKCLHKEKINNYGHALELLEDNGSIRHCNVAQYALSNFAYDHDDIIGVIDGDMFLAKPFSIRETLQEYDVVGANFYPPEMSPYGIAYNWIALSFFRVSSLPNKHTFNLSAAFTEIKNQYILLDSGGNTYNFFLKTMHQSR